MQTNVAGKNEAVIQNFKYSLYFVADPAACNGRAVEDVVRAAVQGGVTMVQLRDKASQPTIIEAQARRIQKVLHGTDIPFLINDHVEIAVAVNADGVHIGQGDMGAADARKMIGDDKILGLTAFTRDHYAAIDPDIVDYVGTGPVFPTLTDKGKPVLGVDGFADVIKYAPVPVVGIGGITSDNARGVMQAGAQGVAMMRAISAADDPCIAAADLLKSIS